MPQTASKTHIILSMRRVVDCYFHVDEQEDAGMAAIECARLYAKAPNGFIKMKEALDVGINQFQDLEKFDEAARYLIEFADVYKNAKRMTDSIECLKKAATIYYENDREFDGMRIDQQIAATFVSLKKWKEASQQYTQYAKRLSTSTTMSKVHDACAKAIFCVICDSGPTLCGSLNDKFAAEIHTWATSQEHELAKNIIETCHTRLESRIRKALDAYKAAKPCDATMNEIFENILKKVLIR